MARPIPHNYAVIRTPSCRVYVTRGPRIHFALCCILVRWIDSDKECHWIEGVYIRERLRFTGTPFDMVNGRWIQLGSANRYPTYIFVKGRTYATTCDLARSHDLSSIMKHERSPISRKLCFSARSYAITLNSPPEHYHRWTIFEFRIGGLPPWRMGPLTVF